MFQRELSQRLSRLRRCGISRDRWGGRVLGLVILRGLVIAGHFYICDERGNGNPVDAVRTALGVRCLGVGVIDGLGAGAEGGVSGGLQLHGERAEAMGIYTSVAVHADGRRSGAPDHRDP